MGLDPFFFLPAFRGSVEVISIIVGGTRYTAFERVMVGAAFNEAAREFRLEVAAEAGASATNAIFRRGAEVQIFANSDLLLTGYVERRQPRFGPNEAQINVSGRSKSADLIDSSAKHETGSFEKMDPMEIGNAVSEGIAARFVTDQVLEKLDQYQVSPGKTVYRTVEEMIRQMAMTITGTPDGNAKITKAGAERHAGGLFEGQNIKIGEADHNDTNRHSEYTVLGQRPFDHGTDALEIAAIARDAAVGRTRPIVIIQKEDTTKGRAKKRARNRKDRAAGNGLKARITAQGFRDQAGKIWTPGHLVWTESPFLDIAQDMLIERVELGQDRGGSLSSLSLVDPKAYDGAGAGGGKGNKSGADWKIGEDED